MQQPLRVLTWHVHGNYLLYLSEVPHELYLPTAPGGAGGRGSSFPLGPNVIEVPEHEVAEREFDVVVFQERRNWLEDRFRILSPAQRRLPSIYVEHDPPRQHPVDQPHWVDDPDVLLVHVTHFNQLMWNTGYVRSVVIEHGVRVPEVAWTGELERGLVVVNDLAARGRRVGRDLFERARREVPLDLAGLASHELGGLGAIAPAELWPLASRYRLFFHPIRWTSLGLALLEAMTIGMPVVAVASTEAASVIEDGVSGVVDTRFDRLVDRMRDLHRDPEEARRLGAAGQRVAYERFGIERFGRDWDRTLRAVAEASVAAEAV